MAIGVESIASSESALLRIDQCGYGVICAGTRGGIGLAVWVRLTILNWEITIRDYEITIPGCDGATIFFVEPPEGSPSYNVFGWLDVKWDTVLNHRIFSERPLPRGQNLEGFVVAQSFGSLASHFRLE